MKCRPPRPFLQISRTTIKTEHFNLMMSVASLPPGKGAAFGSSWGEYNSTKTYIPGQKQSEICHSCWKVQKGNVGRSFREPSYTLRGVTQNDEVLWAVIACRVAPLWKCSFWGLPLNRPETLCGCISHPTRFDWQLEFLLWFFVGSSWLIINVGKYW